MPWYSVRTGLVHAGAQSGVRASTHIWARGHRGPRAERETHVADGAPTAEPNISSNMFRAYDIRGLAGTDLTPEITRLIGQAWGTWLRRRGGSSMVVGGDLRPHTPGLK